HQASRGVVGRDRPQGRLDLVERLDVTPFFASRRVSVAFVLLLLAQGCGSHDEGIPKADMDLFAERFALTLEAAPLGPVVLNHRMYPDLEKDIGAPRRISPLSPAEEAALFAEWAHWE